MKRVYFSVTTIALLLKSSVFTMHHDEKARVAVPVHVGDSQEPEPYYCIERSFSGHQTVSWLRMSELVYKLTIEVSDDDTVQTLKEKIPRAPGWSALQKEVAQVVGQEQEKIGLGNLMRHVSGRYPFLIEVKEDQKGEGGEYQQGYLESVKAGTEDVYFSFRVVEEEKEKTEP